MIRSLSIKNYAIIEHLVIDFSDALTIITGETGAGKSIMLGALGLIMGKRADTKILYNQAEKCVVEAVFDVEAYGLESFFDALDLDYEKETYVRREITPSGKTRAFVNDTPVKLGILKAISDKLLDLHQQFDTHGIGDPDFQMQVIDALGGNQTLLEDYQVVFSAYEKAQRQLNKLLKQEREAAKESDYLAFQLEELLEADLLANETSELEQEQKTLGSAEDIKRVLSAAAGQINDEDTAIHSQMISLSNSLSSLGDCHEALPKLIERFDSLMFEVEELGNEFQSIAEDTEYDEERLEFIAERLNSLYKLCKKHHVADENGLISLRDELQTKLNSYEDVSGQIGALEIKINELEVELVKLAKQLSENRINSCPAFEEKVKELLRQLSMKHAVLKVEVEKTSNFTATGRDALRFLFCANKGGRLEEVKAVASGGELSRLALCIKSLVASSIPLPTVIFDEIDAGVSGEVAQQMGVILKKQSKEHQVICITHSPQIAAKADCHYFVHKKVTETDTLTSIRKLSMDERILELAKMLSGDPPSVIAQQNARHLLGVTTA